MSARAAVEAPGIALPAAVDTVLAVSAARQVGAGSAVADVGMQVGGALGTAVSGSVIATSTATTCLRLRRCRARPGTPYASRCRAPPRSPGS
ncbi:hypothetical protein [Streptomyces sp. ME18-1-4]|uniref:hypothetical protein n=1 Tax=Streptomyces sp. ME18-1-4 TaxID=3028685 RepID=UPI0029A54E68|nr:hypothetical protein [Streptomyces sp. ME18-1-4]MDX3244612.1 hypothetical protein [Streptomyces sp. ME18-1-4]